MMDSARSRLDLADSSILQVFMFVCDAYSNVNVHASKATPEISLVRQLAAEERRRQEQALGNIGWIVYYLNDEAAADLSWFSSGCLSVWSWLLGGHLLPEACRCFPSKVWRP